MENSKLIRLLKTFSAKDMRLLSEFIHSPYFNKNKNIVSFFTLIEKSYPGFSTQIIKREAVFKRLFPKQKYDDVKIRGLLSDTFELTKEFLAMENMKRQQLSSESFILNELALRQCHELYEIELKKIKQHKDKIRYDKIYFLNNLLLLIEESEYRIYNVGFSEAKLVRSNVFEERYKRLMDFFIYELYVISLIMNSFEDRANYSSPLATHLESVLGVSVKIQPQDEIFRYLELLHEMQIKKAENAYLTLRNKILSEPFTNISNHNKRIIIELTMGHLINQFMLGNYRYSSDTFLLNKKYIEFGLHIYNGIILETQFVNFVIDAAKNKEFEWAHGFINSNASKLPADTRSNVENFCKGFLHEQTGRFSEALSHLSKIDKAQGILSVNIRLLLTKIFYAKSDMDQVLQTATNFGKFLKRENKFPPQLRESLLNFVKYVSELSKIRLNGKRAGLTELIAEIEKQEKINLKGWLLQKAKEQLMQ